MARISLAKKPPIVTKEDYLSTYTNPEDFRARKGADFLEKKGLLPLEYTSELFPQINLIVAGLMWSGSFSDCVETKTPQLNLNLRNDLSEQLNEEISELETKIVANRLDYYHLSKNGAAYSRLISKIPGMMITNGKAKRETKTSLEFRFPEYFDFIVDRYDQLADKRYAKKILSDNVVMLLLTRLKSSDRTKNYGISLPMRKDKKTALELAADVMKVINKTYPAIGLDEESLGAYKTSTGDYGPVINLRFDHMFNAFKFYNLFTIELNRNLAECGKRTGKRKRYR